MPPVRILLIDEQPLFRLGLRRALEPAADLVLVAEASAGVGALLLADQVAPDIVLCARHLPDLDGLALTRQLRQHQPRCGVIVLSADDTDEQLFQALQAGAAAVVSDTISGPELVAVIRQVNAGTYVINEQVLGRPQVAVRLLQAFREVADLPGPAAELFSPLSRREMEVLACVAQGDSNKEIAVRLGLSQQTVKNHISSVLRKLAVNSRTQAVLRAARRGWITLEDFAQSTR